MVGASGGREWWAGALNGGEKAPRHKKFQAPKDSIERRPFHKWIKVKRVKGSYFDPKLSIKVVPFLSPIIICA